MASIKLNKQTKTIKVINKTENIKVVHRKKNLKLNHTGKAGPAGPQGPTGVSTFVRVHHGSDPNVPRPDALYVEWVGSAEPVNGTSEDTWIDSDSEAPAATVEGVDVLSTGETGGNKFLRENGDGTSSWQVLTGDGDMLASVYDPTTKAVDAFDMANMVENTDAKVMTAAERTILSNTSGTNTGDQDISGKADKTNVLELDNTDIFTPDADYEPATKKYVDDNAGGGSNPYNATIIVAASGGDYTTLSDALGSAVAGDVIFIEAGSYGEAGGTFAQNNIRIIGENVDETVLTPGANLVLSGTGVQLESLFFDMGASYILQMTGQYAKLNGCHIIGSRSGFYFESTASYASITNSRFEAGSASARVSIDDRSRITGNLFVTPHNTSGGVYIDQNAAAISGNTFKSYALSTGGGPLLRVQDNNTVTGNTFHCGNGSAISTDMRVAVTGNAIYQGGGDVIRTTDNCTIADNVIHVNNPNSNGVFINSSTYGSTVTGNMVTANALSTGSRGVYAFNGDGHIISNNSITLLATGIEVYSAVSNAIVAFNEANTCTTALTDNGTGTVFPGAGGMAELLDDTTPQLGGDLDPNGHAITGYLPSIDEDNMSSDSAIHVPTQQSVKQYVDNNAGGGNPYGATYVLATSGGDYTNLATALTAMVAGDILYVEPGTYSNSGLSTALNNITIIGKNAQTCIFANDNSSHNIFSGTDVRIQNIKMTNVVAGRWIFQGESLVIERCIHQGNDTFSLVVQGQYSRIVNNEFSVTAPADDMIWQFSGTKMVVADNTFYSANGSNASGSNKAVVVFASMNGTFSGNSIYAGGSTNEAPALGVEASDCSVTGNSIETTATNVGIFTQGSFTAITGNSIDNCKVGIVVGNQQAVITGNAIRCASSTSQQGIRAGSYCVISGNHVFGTLSASGVGISVPANKDYVTIVGNMIFNFVTGVRVDASTSDDTVIMGNSIVGATTEISDTGTNTLKVTATDSDPLNR